LLMMQLSSPSFNVFYKFSRETKFIQEMVIPN